MRGASILLSVCLAGCFFHPVDEPGFIVYQVGGCDGFCPAYEMKISHSGLVEYEGKKWNKEIGWYKDLKGEYRIPPRNVDSLLLAMQDLRILALPDSFTYGIRVSPKGDSAIYTVDGISPRLLTISTETIKKSTYDGGGYAPNNFSVFIRRMMVLAETSRWL